MNESIRKILADKNLLNDVSNKAFEAVDVDHSGFIERDELRLILDHISSETGAKPMEDEQVNKILDFFDKDKNGKIDRPEFKIMVETIVQQMIFDDGNNNSHSKSK